MESALCAVALLILAVAGLADCASIDSKLRKLNNRINKRISNMQQNMLHSIDNMQLNIADLEFENRELRKELEGEKNRTSELEIKLNSALSRGSPAITDNAARDSTVQEVLLNQTSKKIQEIGNVVLALDEKVKHLKKSHEHIKQLGVAVRKAVMVEKTLIRKVNGTLNSYLYNTTCNYQDKRQEIAQKLEMIDIRVSRNEKILMAVSDCGSHKEIPYGDVSGDSFVGGTPVISCDSGYSQTGSALCKAPVSWETDIKCQKDCSRLNVANGMANPPSDVSHGTSVTVICDSGFTIIGTNAVICDNGAFAGVPTCLKDCSRLNVANGMANPPSDVSHGTSVTVMCDSGFTMTGHNAVICDNGAFAGVPTCLKDCAIPHVANGMVTPGASVSHGTTVTVTCDSGYKIDGNNTAACNNGVFTGGTRCRRIFNFSDMVVDSSSSFNVKFDEELTEPWISGAEFLSDGRLLLCNFVNPSMKLLGSDFTKLEIFQAGENPWDVSAVNSTTVLVTLPFRQQLKYIHVVPHTQVSSKLQLDSDCWGVVVVGDEVFTSCRENDNHQGEILVLDLVGTLKRRLGGQNGNSYMFRHPDYLTVNQDTGDIYVSDALALKVTCLSSTGDIIYQYDDPELRRPYGILIDDAGNIIVCIYFSNKVHVINVRGKKDKTLLTSSDGLQKPYSVAYRESDATLVIGGENNDLLVFKLKH